MANKSQIKKQCTRCKQTVSISDYKPCRSTKDKLQVWCNKCRRAYALDRYNKNKAAMNTARTQLNRDKKLRAEEMKEFLANQPPEEEIKFDPAPAPENPFLNYLDSVDDIV